VLRGGARFHAGAVGSEDLAAELYERACEALPRAGFGQYEISNFARAGFASRHNSKYWTRAAYVGFGLDAHSMLPRAGGGELRFANTDELGSYGLSGRTLPQVVDEDAAFEESLFLGLRMVRGVDVEELRKKFGSRVDGVSEVMRGLVRGGLMVEGDGRWALTARGRMVSNEVFGELVGVGV
jgi:oxygen-independent coproporphyrinogen-3 oxidase